MRTAAYVLTGLAAATLVTMLATGATLLGVASFGGCLVCAMIYREWSRSLPIS